MVFKSIQLLLQHKSLCLNYFQHSLQFHKSEPSMYKQNITAERLLRFNTWLKIKYTSNSKYCVQPF